MSDHLPECPGPAPCDRWDICDRLRACEQRVRMKGVNAIVAAQANSYQQGVQAARDAVAAVEMGGEHFWSVGFRDGITIALAAIDALRGDK